MKSPWAKAVIGIAVTTLFLVAGCAGRKDTGRDDQKVLLLIRHGALRYGVDSSLTEEVGVMTRLLQEAGFRVTIASATGETIEGETQRLIPGGKLADERGDSYRGVIIPCLCTGSVGSDWTASADEIAVVRQAANSGRPIAAQKGSIIILAEAGVLRGKRYATLVYNKDDKIFKGAVYAGQGVIRDGNIITSSNCPNVEKFYGNSLPDGTAELTRTFIKALKGI